MKLETTPWGRPDFHREIAPGIDWYSTPSHGGFCVSDERLAQMPEPFKSHKPFCGEAGWYEEDCDWSAVVLSFPQFFSVDETNQARRTWAGMKNCPV